MTLRAWPLVLAIIVGCAALEKEERTNVADGLACEASTECVSRECKSGYCAGGSCDTKDPASCDPGWRCTVFKGGIFSSGSVECVPLCGKCPANQHCPATGEEGSTPCLAGAPRKVTITGPATVKPNTNVTFTATVDPPFAEVTFVEWRVGSKPGQGDTFGPDSITTTTKLEVHVEGEQFVTATVHGRDRQNVFEEADGFTSIRFECLAQGEVCDADGEGHDHPQECCAKGLYCPGLINGKGPYYCTPQN